MRRGREEIEDEKEWLSQEEQGRKRGDKWEEDEQRRASIILIFG